MDMLIQVMIVVALLTAIIFLIYALFVLRDFRSFLNTGQGLSSRAKLFLDRLQPELETAIAKAQVFFGKGGEVMERMEKNLDTVELLLNDIRKVQDTVRQINEYLHLGIVSPLKELSIITRAVVKAIQSFLDAFLKPKK